jgi:hypothetical protein
MIITILLEFFLKNLGIQLNAILYVACLIL